MARERIGMGYGRGRHKIPAISRDAKHHAGGAAGGEHEGDSGVRAGSEGGAEVANLELLEHIERGGHHGR